MVSDFIVKTLCPPCRVVSGRFGGSPRVLETHSRDEVEVTRAKVRATKIETELSLKRRKWGYARRARGATEQQASHVERGVGEEFAAEGLEDEK